MLANPVSALQSLSLYSAKMFAYVKVYVNDTAELVPAQGRLQY